MTLILLYISFFFLFKLENFKKPMKLAYTTNGGVYITKESRICVYYYSGPCSVHQMLTFTKKILKRFFYSTHRMHILITLESSFHLYINI